MNAASSALVALAERVERTGGAKAGLVAWRALAARSARGDVRARALVSAMRCALALSDLAAIDALALGWEDAGGGDWADEVVALCKELCKEPSRSDRLATATALARAEARRRATARSLYLLARCLELAGDPAAVGAFSEAAGAARSEGASAIESVARIARIRALSRAPETIPAAVEEARAFDFAHVAPADRIAVAAALLRSSSRFVRAGAIAALDGVVSAGDPDLARAALSTCASHVDDLGDALTPLELDRLLAVFGRPIARAVAPRALEALRAAATIARASDAELEEALIEAGRADPSLVPLHARAREILAGRFEAHDAAPIAAAGGDPRAQVLDAFVALRDGASSRSASALGALAEAAAAGAWVPPQAWNVARLGLEDEHPDVRAAAVRFVAARMHGLGAAPPRGWLDIARALAAAGEGDLAERAHRAAVTAGEAGADDALVRWLTRSAWQLARANERDRAIALLREARALAGGSRPVSTPSR